MKKSLCLVATLLTLLGSTTFIAAQLPNVVILYADDMGVADVSYGNAEAPIQTPNLDRLAAEGMTFTDGHSSSGDLHTKPVCTSHWPTPLAQISWHRWSV